MRNIKTYYHSKWALVFLCVLVFFQLKSQDLHYSQFYNSPQNLNPALTGVFNGDHRFVGSLRDQWRFVPVPWFTFSGTYDRKLFLGTSEKHFLGVGGFFNHDRQGDGNFNLTTLSAQGSYHRILHPDHIVSGGLSLGIASRGFNTQNFTWDKQWNGDAFDPSLSSQEGFDNFERINFLDVGMGLNYRWQKSNRTHIDLGGSVLHLMSPDNSFYSFDLARLPRRWTASLVGNFMLLNFLDIQINGLYQSQGEYNETIVGGLGKIYISQAKGKAYQLHLGAGYRTSGSLFPTVAMQVNNIYASFSYDLDNTFFNQTVGINRGGPELHVRYIIANVKPLKAAKICPIY